MTDAKATRIAEQKDRRADRKRARRIAGYMCRNCALATRRLMYRSHKRMWPAAREPAGLGSWWRPSEEAKDGT